MREALRLLIESGGHYEIVGEVADGARVLAEVQRTTPEAVILDLAMPGLSGSEAARRLRAGGFAGGIVVLSAHAETARVQEALAAGADAYVCKLHAFAQLHEALQASLRRERYVGPELPAPAENRPARNGVADGAAVAALACLTPREREVLQQIAEGHGTKEIAFRLGVSAKTVESHRLNLMRKLEVNNVADLTRLALRAGLVSL